MFVKDIRYIVPSTFALAQDHTRHTISSHQKRKRRNKNGITNSRGDWRRFSNVAILQGLQKLPNLWQYRDTSTMVFNKELKIIITSVSNSVIKKKPTAVAKTSNRQETFNDKAHDQNKLRAEETRQTESSSPYTDTKNMDTGTAKKKKRRTVEKWEILNKKLKEIPWNELRIVSASARLFSSVLEPWEESPNGRRRGARTWRTSKQRQHKCTWEGKQMGIEVHGQQAFMELEGSGIRSCVGRATRQKKAQKWGSYPQGGFNFEENKHKKVLLLKCFVLGQ